MSFHPKTALVAAVSVSALAAGILAFASPSFAERKLARSKVPRPVIEAFEKAWPKAKALAYAEEKKDGKTAYEIESREGSARRDVLFDADGTLIEVEETIAVADLPEAVRSAVTAAEPKAKITKAEKLTRGNEVSYEVDLKGGSRRELAFDAAGKPLDK